jgi:hypothetical protein
VGVEMAMPVGMYRTVLGIAHQRQGFYLILQAWTFAFGSASKQKDTLSKDIFLPFFSF